MSIMLSIAYVRRGYRSGRPYAPGAVIRILKKRRRFCHSRSAGIVQSGRMETQIIQETASKTLAGTITFPEVVGHLLRAGVGFYHVDYISRRKSFYAAEGSAVVVLPIDYEGLPDVAPDFDPVAVKAAILDSQRHGQVYRDFTRRVMAAGVQSYFAFLRGQRVTYLGRSGDQHTEWFPGAGPEARQ